MLTGHQRIELHRRAPEGSEIVEEAGLVMVRVPGGITACAIRIGREWAFGPYAIQGHPDPRMHQAAQALREVMGC